MAAVNKQFTDTSDELVKTQKALQKKDRDVDDMRIKLETLTSNLQTTTNK